METPSGRKSHLLLLVALALASAPGKRVCLVSEAAGVVLSSYHRCSWGDDHRDY